MNRLQNFICIQGERPILWSLLCVEIQIILFSLFHGNTYTMINISVSNTIPKLLGLQSGMVS